MFAIRDELFNICDIDCQRCRKHKWQVQLHSVRGKLFLCGPCAADVQEERVAKSGNLARAYAFLLNKLFGKEQRFA